MKLSSFTDLKVWQEGHHLVLIIYKMSHTFPNEERYGLTNQMRRSSVSITSNIAEGFSRKGKQEKAQFYYISKGSLTELQNQLMVAKDLSYISNDNFTQIAQQSILVGKLLTGLIKSQRNK